MDRFELVDSRIKNKNILIFDDSIKSGKTIRKNIRNVLKFSPKKIVIFSIVNLDDSFNKLEENYRENNKIKLYFFDKSPEEIFTDVWRMIIWPIIEYHGLPLIETPYTIGEIKNEEELLKLYRSVVIDKSSAASIIYPAVVEESLVVKGSINYTKFFDKKYKEDGIDHSKIFLRFFFLKYSPSRIIFLLYPDLFISDIKIEDTICEKNRIFPCCFGTMYDGDVCPDCVIYNLSKQINEYLHSICSEKLKIKRIVSDNKEFLQRYYPLMLKNKKC